MAGVNRPSPMRYRFAAGSVCAALLLAGALPARAACERLDDKFWSTVEECRSAAAVKGYLKVYPEGCHVEKAKACLDGLKRLAQGPKCSELGDGYSGAKDAACWQEIRHRPGCHAWNPHYHSDRQADWTGSCVGGVANGPGSFFQTAGSEHESATNAGAFLKGKRHGRWVERQANGDVYEGPYVDGKERGRWIMRDADGDVREGPYVDGKRHGRWVERQANGDVYEGPYVDGKERGRWIMRDADGDVREGPFVDGKRHGRWVLRDADGDVREGPYVDGKRHGRWVLRDADGDVREGPYVDGKRHGRWVVSYASGGRLEHEYRNGSTEGQPGVFVTEDGKRYPGKWSGGCFRDFNGTVRVKIGGAKCPPK